LGRGDRFVAFDPEQQLEADVELIAVPRRTAEVRVRVGALRQASMCPSRPLTLIQAIAKDAKLAAIVRDGTELGATRVVATITERTIKRPRESGRWLTRLRKVAVQAARQCGRGDVPEILGPWPMEEAVAKFAPAGRGLGWCLEPSAETPLRQAVGQLAEQQALTLVVGPEGGLSPNELELCSEHGYLAVSLGPLVLRTETVCAAVLGAVLARG